MTIPLDLDTAGIAQLGEALRSRQLTVRALVQHGLDRIAQHNAAGANLNAVRTLSPDALEAADAMQAELDAGRDRGPLHGIPYLAKDNIMVAGLRASSGVRALAEFVPSADATIVRRLRDAGAILLGKTNMTELADYVSDVMPSEFSGAGGVVKNPHGPRYDRGQGSSVGSASAVAAGFAPFAIGSETQNSIQTPATRSSLVGFKPTVGFASRAGIAPLVASQDSPGPLARSVADAALVSAVLCAPDPRDGLTMRWVHERRQAIAATAAPLGGLRIGVPRRAMADKPAYADSIGSFTRVLDALRQAGVTLVDPCDVPSSEQLLDVVSSVFRAEFKASFDAFLQEHGSPCGIDSLQALVTWNASHPEAIPYGQVLMERAAATGPLHEDTYLADRARDLALALHGGIEAALDLGQADALLLPMDAAARMTGKAGAPVLAIPMGKGDDGQPFGVTLVARPGADAQLLSIGMAVEGVCGQRLLPRL
ncbi:amidase family protein [Variovorax sp. VNK109]|uniref:amidase family protein n=1 Tax=Variovorax sp. VNK109 TaxID=3400919 RepID=UPI003C0EA53C